MSDQITLSLEEVHAPIQYNSFRFGVSVTLDVAEGEPIEDVLNRAKEKLSTFASESFAETRDAFFTRHEQLNPKATQTNSASASRVETTKETLAQHQQTRSTSNPYDDTRGNDNNLGVNNPIARSLSDLVTAKQLGMIRALAREKGLDPEDECGKVFKNCKTDELSRKAASALITHLQDAPAWENPQQQLLATPNGDKSSEAKIVEKNLEAKNEQTSSEEKKVSAATDDDIPF